MTHDVDFVVILRKLEVKRPELEGRLRRLRAPRSKIISLRFATVGLCSVTLGLLGALLHTGLCSH